MDGGLKQRIQQIEGLIAQIRSSTDAPTRDSALDLLHIVMEFHATGIDRMMEIAADSGDAGWRIIDDFGRDEVVANLLLLHGLHPLDLETRVRNALDKVRPYLHSHGGNVELVKVTDGVVRLKLVGNCSGCPSSSLTLKTAIEKAIYEAAPDVTSIESDGTTTSGGAKEELVWIHNAR
jgi:Fe-S cluster biogenesis protein NfuA